MLRNTACHFVVMGAAYCGDGDRHVPWPVTQRYFCHAKRVHVVIDLSPLAAPRTRTHVVSAPRQLQHSVAQRHHQFRVPLVTRLRPTRSILQGPTPLSTSVTINKPTSCVHFYDSLSAAPCPRGLWSLPLHSRYKQCQAVNPASTLHASDTG